MDVCYAMLGLSKDASPADARKAYYNMARVFHPDKGGDIERFKQLRANYDLLLAHLQKKVTMAGFCAAEGFVHHRCGDTTCDPAMMDWIVGDSTIRTSRSRAC